MRDKPSQEYLFFIPPNPISQEFIHRSALVRSAWLIFQEEAKDCASKERNKDGIIAEWGTSVS